MSKVNDDIVASYGTYGDELELALAEIKSAQGEYETGDYGKTSISKSKRDEILEYCSKVSDEIEGSGGVKGPFGLVDMSDHAWKFGISCMLMKAIWDDAWDLGLVKYSSMVKM